MTAVSALDLTSFRVGRASAYHHKSPAGGVRLSDGTGWVFTVVAARPDVPRGSVVTGVVLSVLADIPPADWDAMPGWLWRDRYEPGRDINGRIEVTFAVRPDTTFEQLP